MRKELVKYPSPILRQIAKPVKKIDDSIREILSDMVDTMYAEDGVGIAAPQIGVPLRLVAIDLAGAVENNEPGLLKIVNPEIIQREGEIEWEEGCLSVPDMRVKMKRSQKLTARFLDENGEHHEIKVQGLLAIAFQQEIDHLDGKLIIDSVSRLKQEIYLKKIKKAAQERQK